MTPLFRNPSSLQSTTNRLPLQPRAMFPHQPISYRLAWRHGQVNIWIPTRGDLNHVHLFHFVVVPNSGSGPQALMPRSHLMILSFSGWGSLGFALCFISPLRLGLCGGQETVSIVNDVCTASIHIMFCPIS
jgi:hypothetical protein